MEEMGLIKTDRALIERQKAEFSYITGCLLLRTATFASGIWGSVMNIAFGLLS